MLDTDLSFLKARRISVMCKEVGSPVHAHETLSTAGRPVVLTAPKVVSALQALDAEKERNSKA